MEVTCKGTRTFACVSKRKCRVPEHLEGRRMYNRRIGKLNDMGRKARVDATPAMKRINRMTSEEFNLEDVSRATGIARSTLLDLQRGRSKRIHIDNYNKIMAVTRAKLKASRWAGDTTPAVIQRYVDALALRGYPGTFVFKKAGITPEALRYAHAENIPVVNRATSDAIRRVSRELWLSTPEAHEISPMRQALAIRNAKKRGAIPGGAWDNIDDPHATPDLGGESSADSWLEDLTDLIDAGCSWDDISARLGVKPHSLESKCRRHGRADLLERIRRAAA